MRFSCGFSLIELAIVMLVLSLLIGSLLLPLSAQVEIRRHQQTARALREVTDALIGYTLVHKRLPCPASDEWGREDATLCATEGYLPWAELGTGRMDAWKNPLRYRADAAYTGTIPPTTHPASGLRVENLAAEDLTPSDSLPGSPSRLVAVVFSCGKNGKPDGKNAHGPAPRCVNTGTTNAVYAQDQPTESFDDKLIWLSRNQLIQSLNRAGKWP